MKISETGEKCPKCGAPIKRMGTYTIPCECESKEKEEQEKNALTIAENERREKMRVFSGLSLRNVEQTFNFTANKNQEKAKKYCENWCNNYINNTLSKDRQSIMLVGTVGSGKTHLASAILNSIIDNHKIKINKETEILQTSIKSPYIFTTALDMFLELSQIYTKTVDAMQTINKFKECKLLIIDDLGGEKTTDRSKEFLQSIIDYRYSNYLPVIITTNLSADELKMRYDERTIDRLRDICEFLTITGESNRGKKYPA